jgi:hypothetical protein
MYRQSIYDAILIEYRSTYQDHDYGHAGGKHSLAATRRLVLFCLDLVSNHRYSCTITDLCLLQVLENVTAEQIYLNSIYEMYLSHAQLNTFVNPFNQCLL